MANSLHFAPQTLHLGGRPVPEAVTRPLEVMCGFLEPVHCADICWGLACRSSRRDFVIERRGPLLLKEARSITGVGASVA